MTEFLVSFWPRANALENSSGCPGGHFRRTKVFGYAMHTKLTAEYLPDPCLQRQVNVSFEKILSSKTVITTLILNLTLLYFCFLFKIKRNFSTPQSASVQVHLFLSTACLISPGLSIRCRKFSPFSFFLHGQEFLSSNMHIENLENGHKHFNNLLLVSLENGFFFNL